MLAERAAEGAARVRIDLRSPVQLIEQKIEIETVDAEQPRRLEPPFIEETGVFRQRLPVQMRREERQEQLEQMPDEPAHVAAFVADAIKALGDRGIAEEILVETFGKGARASGQQVAMRLEQLAVALRPVEREFQFLAKRFRSPAKCASAALGIVLVDGSASSARCHG